MSKQLKLNAIAALIGYVMGGSLKAGQ